MNPPPPATVPQHLWRDIEAAPLGSFQPEARVAVVVDGAGTQPDLGAQTYPAELIHVIDAGAQAPDGEIVIVLPAGAEPAPEFVAAHARWHHVAADAVSLGPVGVDGGDPLGLVRDLTRDLTDLAGGYHLAAADGSIGMHRALYEAAGAAGTVPPEVRRLDLLYRLHCAGAVFAVEPAALARGTAGWLADAVARACEAGETLELIHPEAAAIVPLPPFRGIASARRHARPALAVNLPLDEATPADEALASIRGALAGRLGDLELRVQVPEGHPSRSAVAAAVADHPRAALARSSLAEACEAPFQVTLPALASLDPRTLGDLHELALGEDVGALHVTVPGAAPQDGMVEVVATAAWRRAQRLSATTGEAPEQIIGRLFGERWVSGVEVSTRRHGVEEPQVTEHGPLAAATDLGHERNAHLRFRERATDLEERAATLAQRALVERLHARAERQAAERVESRLDD